MTAIALDGVSKHFGTSIALDDVSLAVPEGAFLALLGPSGCGKTTILRLIAGFEAPTRGVVRFGARTVATAEAQVPPEERQVAMVFQSYALWPHMTVAENVAYPLATARRPKSEVAGRVAEALHVVGLAGYGERRPEALSGGQRQRVALARALVQEAPLVLCDEPLANLDVHLRAAMLASFRRLHRDTGRTFVYVTHDQAEALALATHIAVLDGGRLAQLGAPQAIYAAPATEAVARFVGEGRILDAVTRSPVEAGRLPVRLAGAELMVRAPAGTRPGAVKLLVRPENVMLGGPLAAVVRGATYRGPAWAVEATLHDGQSLMLALPAAPREGDRLDLAVTDAWVVPAI
ncbi:ABC transporter ATP-binding protein [Chelatococcus sp. SYSU_G07232]|uniref:ABC transporter ATP-binding protein n=1 Tax=Chelatococcus albus TaxID=3047466 RepID=A0ABT7AL74_9HYPH|nr:ABC transporter ATP-binding protein [Chelatococcus sp. SYSU_G07232]MDJ1160128.1 ABC transporter ATP-binding protein [Chelatococcus sp. SYSU_G07232]